MELRPLIGTAFSTVVGLANRVNVTDGHRFRPLVVLSIAIVGLLNGSAVHAQDSNRVDRVKTAIVLNIARFVSWPADDRLYQSDRTYLCLYRDNPLQQAMASIAGEEIGGRPIEIRQIQSLSDSESCSILSIAAAELQTFLGEVTPDFRRPMLTIADLTETDLPIESRRGILIALIRNGARIGFEIDLEKSRHTGLRFSSELLKLANIVGENN